MPISEIFNNTLGTMVAFESSAAGKATSSGITATGGIGGNDWLRTNTYSMDNSNNAFDIEFKIKWGDSMYVGVSDGRSWGTWGGCWAICISNDGKIYVSQIGGPNYNGINHGLLSGDTATVRMKYDNGKITAYLNGVEKTSYNVDLSSYTKMYPLLWVRSEDYDYLWSYEELVESGISASKRIINC